MTRLLAIAFLIAIAFVLIRYRTSEKLQKYVVITLVSSFLIYTATIMVTELIR
jgi:Ca2+/Na+ antiporter